MTILSLSLSKSLGPNSMHLVAKTQPPPTGTKATSEAPVSITPQQRCWPHKVSPGRRRSKQRQPYTGCLWVTEPSSCHQRLCIGAKKKKKKIPTRRQHKGKRLLLDFFLGQDLRIWVLGQDLRIWVGFSNP
jgi:hypothetical protein